MRAILRQGTLDAQLFAAYDAAFTAASRIGGQATAICLCAGRRQRGFACTLRTVRASSTWSVRFSGPVGHWERMHRGFSWLPSSASTLQARWWTLQQTCREQLAQLRAARPVCAESWGCFQHRVSRQLAGTLSAGRPKVLTTGGPAAARNKVVLEQDVASHCQTVVRMASIGGISSLLLCGSL